MAIPMSIAPDEARGRIPPHNSESERSVLGSMLLDPNAISEVLEVLTAEDFWVPAHREIYNSMCSLDRTGQPIDLVTVGEDLRQRGELERVGGQGILLDLVNSTPTSVNAGRYAKYVRDHARLRRLITAAGEISEMGYEAAGETAEILDRAESMIFEVAQHGSGELFAPVQNLLDETLMKLEERFNSSGSVTGLTTGFRDLDELTSGLQPSNLIVVAARPSMGKTALALGIAQNAARSTGKSVAIFSLEMSKTELVQRLLSSEAEVDSNKLRTGRMGDTDWSDLMNAAGRMANDPLFIDDSGALTVMELRAKCRRLASRQDLGLVIVDYMQLMESSSHRREANRQQDISEISRSLKVLARELNIPVIAVSQLNRAPEARSDKRPLLGDLRESGAIEQDADIVIFLYRDSYYDPETPDKGQAEVIVAKHRNGRTATVRLLYLDHFTKFRDLTTRPAPEF